MLHGDSNIWGYQGWDVGKRLSRYQRLDGRIANTFPLIPLLAIPTLKNSKQNFAFVGSGIVILGTAVIWIVPTNIPVLTVGSFIRGIGNAMFFAVCWDLLAYTVNNGQ